MGLWEMVFFKGYAYTDAGNYMTHCGDGEALSQDVSVMLKFWFFSL